MKAILLAAGMGTRLRPLTDSTPKCLIPVLGKPLLEYWIEMLLHRGSVERILINTHYLSSKVEEFVKNSPWEKSIDLAYEDSLLGTGGTLLANRSWIANETVIVAHADNLTIFDPFAFIAAHENRPVGCSMTMMTFNTDDPKSCGIVETRDGVVVGFHEKVPDPPGSLANGAVYIFEPGVIESLIPAKKRIIDISTEILPSYLGGIWTYHNDKYHRDIGSLRSLEIAQREFSVWKKCPRLC